jgi:hypothetical protein
MHGQASVSQLLFRLRSTPARLRTGREAYERDAFQLRERLLFLWRGRAILVARIRCQQHEYCMSSRSIFARMVIALLGVLALWAVYLLVVGYFCGSDWLKRGQFGDTFGALNTLFTGWAFVGVVATLFLQSRQIEEAKRDIEEQREIQKKTAELLHQQAAALSTSARIQALTSRIQAYTFQIDDLKQAPYGSGSNSGELIKRLIAERRTLIVQLDDLVRSNN